MYVQNTKFGQKTVLWGTITWSVMGKQNLQAKNVYSSTHLQFLENWKIIFITKNLSR